MRIFDKVGRHVDSETVDELLKNLQHDVLIDKIKKIARNNISCYFPVIEQS